ncbi:outer membrane lipoprotein-sorting protein [Parabacteroides sp. PFB2-10]|uniref:LolA family protein n=1 Tax=Parabacteroides sp. PFB2-10 TaxID=1742405 RepID=UPI002474CE39|nr:LolA-like putative outer membrane lipoprotein chaperone [Parabacteroides sp. PFB2-10]MDH6311909.1 outer membrane lipoprotein-sorting protein [Parabacteroides sp. PFB2-10]
MMKNKLIRYIIAVVLLGVVVLPTAAQCGGEVLDKAAAAFEEANGISARFAMNMRAEGAGLIESFEGQLQMKGDKFTLFMPDVRIWFDGKTQWAYMVGNEEVNVTEPTGEELQYLNPALLLGSYKKEYKAELKGESSTASGRMAYNVELTPKKKGDITRVTLQIEKKSYLPARIEIDMKNGSRTLIQIDEIKMGINQPDAFFVFNTKDYPDAEVIDLR